MYDFERPDNAFIVTVFPLNGDEPLREVTLPTTLLRDTAGVSQGLQFAVLADLGLPVSTPERVRLVIRTQHQTKFWGFAAITNNETQHITVISPTRPAAD